ncbi:MAG: hypothetical protein UT25_C0003G0014 [Parcubacteria group bacterium GW2011_GWC1_39_12]|nr:MAG: hypothetical protein UT25_C0003G0014 [Parcubacteria group bacterium GW2011_GWC1_39_12]
MKNINKILAIMVFSAVFTLGFSGPTSIFAATTPSLGTAGTYGVLSETFTRNVGVTTIIGDLGYTTLSGSGTHTISGSVFVVPPAQAGTDQAVALSNLDLQACTFTFAPGAVDLATDTTHGPMGVYTPGVYCTLGAASIGTAGITLTGTGTYIFRVTGALTTVDNSSVTLANSASSCDVFWTPTAATTLGANTSFKGVVIDDSGITIGNTTAWIGRALAFNGTVTSNTDTITSTCTTALPTPPTPPTPVPVPVPGNWWAPLPLINVTKIPSPLALPAGPGSVTYTFVATNVGIVPMSSVWVRDDKCSPVNYISGDSNSNLFLDVSESWTYRCTKQVLSTETNTVTAHGWSNGADGYDTANATVVVGSSLTPPLIHLVKILGITDDKCTGLPGRVTGHPGDINKNNLLDPGETFYFTCITNITQTTTNIGTATGSANGFTISDVSSATVVVMSPIAVSPGFPNTGFPPEESSNKWGIAMVSSIFVLILAFALMFAVKRIG